MTSNPQTEIRDRKKAPRRACIFTCPEGAVQFAETADQQGRFSITAYDGGITKHWYWGNFAIDLQGLSFAAKRLPVLDSHWTDARLGFTTAQDIGEKVTFEGRFLNNVKAKELRQDMLDGFPMQASLYPAPRKIEQVADGASAQVNGKTLKGPGAIFREAQITEVSMCVFGALKNTQSTAFADHDTEEIEFELLGKDTPMAPETKPALTVETFKAEHPDIHQAVHEAGQKAGIEFEKNRFAALRKACGDDTGLLADCFTAGLTVADALNKRNEKLAAELKAANEKLAAAPSPASKVAAATAEFTAQPRPNDPAQAFDEAKATDTELEAHFAATPALRDQFSSAKAYIAHVRHPPQR